MGIIEILEGHNDKVGRLEYRPEECPYNREGNCSLSPRQLIRRTVRYIKDGMVHRFDCFVMLWLCKNCCRSFRHLPAFLKPHKRFITPSILERVSKVILPPGKSYRSASRNDPPRRTRICYNEGHGDALSHVSIWRWIQWMGEMMAFMLSENPTMATDTVEDDFEFSMDQAVEPKCRENLYLARRLWLGQHLVPK